MSDLSDVTYFVALVLTLGIAIGLFTWYNNERKKKSDKKLSKKQKRELNERL